MYVVMCDQAHPMSSPCQFNVIMKLKLFCVTVFSLG